MNAKLVSKENNTANFTFEVGAEKFDTVTRFQKRQSAQKAY